MSGSNRKRRKSHVMGIWDMGTVLTSHPLFAEGLCRTGKGIEESTMDPAKGSSGSGNSLQRHRAVTSRQTLQSGKQEGQHFISLTLGVPPPASSGLGFLMLPWAPGSSAV